jgi:hypothetical protein
MSLRPHKFERIGSFYPWLVCSHCGLVTIKNKKTSKAIQGKCLDRVTVFGMKVYNPNGTPEERKEHAEALKRFLKASSD